ncbi:MAG: helix-turn-helix domain-containing protein [Peptococcaceae bacterium]|nr:helix-turn-helix domain-containing protein [Peptococcaceae bacterium]
MEFSEFVKNVRIELQFSQQKLANALNVNFTTINRWENARVMPSNLALKSFYEFCQDNFIDIPPELRGTDE